MSLLSTDNNYITDVAGSGPSPTSTLPYYIGTIFKNQCDSLSGASTISALVAPSGTWR